MPRGWNPSLKITAGPRSSPRKINPDFLIAAAFSISAVLFAPSTSFSVTSKTLQNIFHATKNAPHPLKQTH